MHGGFNAALLDSQAIMSGLGIGNTTVGVNTPVMAQVEVAPVTIVDLKPPTSSDR